jgi:hypothetical protein
MWPKDTSVTAAVAFLVALIIKRKRDREKEENKLSDLAPEIGHWAEEAQRPVRF